MIKKNQPIRLMGHCAAKNDCSNIPNLAMKHRMQLNTVKTETKDAMSQKNNEHIDLKRNERASHGCLGRTRKDAKSENCTEGTEKYRYPKGETLMKKEPSELKHLSSLRKRNQKRFRK